MNILFLRPSLKKKKKQTTTHWCDAAVQSLRNGWLPCWSRRRREKLSVHLELSSSPAVGGEADRGSTDSFSLSFIPSSSVASLTARIELPS